MSRGFLIIIVLLSLIAVTSCLCSSSSSQRHTIKHVVVLMEENRSFDHLFGWAAKLLGIDGLTGKEYNPVSTFNASSERIYVTDDAPQIAPCDPNHCTFATTSKIFGMKESLRGNLTDECMCGFYEFEHVTGKKAGCDTMKGFKPEKLPVLMQLAQEFAIMDQFHCSVPGPTWPNRQFAMAATSGGSTETLSWFEGEVGRLFPQKTFFDQLEEVNKTWVNYYQDTPWELFMEKLAKSPDNIQTMDRFHDACRLGTLPTYSFINPRSAINVTTGEGSNDFHPDHDAALAEKYIKEVYEAVRASPAWNDTLLIVTFDEHGGFYDHVKPPRPAPPPDSIPAFPDINFHFDRLGIRIPTILISPWIQKGQVLSHPPAHAKPTATSAYDLTSIMSSLRHVLNMTSVGNLTKRDAWAATFHHVLEYGNESSSLPRTDCPVKLKEPVEPVKGFSKEEAQRPLNGLQEFIMSTLNDLNGGRVARDVSGKAPRYVEGEEAVFKATNHAKTQGEAGQWMQHHHERHQARAKRWKIGHSDGIELVVTPLMEWYWLLRAGDSRWNVNKDLSNATKFVTISSRQLSTERVHGSNPDHLHDAEPYCWTAMNATTRVGVAPCFPSTEPSKNRDRNQLWLWQPDATIRPATNSSLCVTNSAWQKKLAVTLEPCRGDVTQHYLWMGPAPGNVNYGFIQFGNAIYNVGAVDPKLIGFDSMAQIETMWRKQENSDALSLKNLSQTLRR